MKEEDKTSRVKNKVISGYLGMCGLDHFLLFPLFDLEKIEKNREITKLHFLLNIKSHIKFDLCLRIIIVTDRV